MWVRGAAIRPVPRYAVVPRNVLDEVERALAADDESGRAELDGAFRRFERSQPELAEWIRELLSRPLDETALALGYFLSIAVWMGFEKTFGPRLHVVSEDSLRATAASLDLEEQLRAEHGEEPLDLDDVVAMEQPGVLAFVNGHIEAALERVSRAESEDVDVDDVHRVYRAIVAMALALSHAVLSHAGSTVKQLPA